MKFNENMQARKIMLTIAAAKHSKEEIIEKLKKYTWIGQKEISESEFEHFQIFICQKRNPISFKTLKNKFPTAHIEKAFGNIEECYRYCTKEKTRAPNTVPFGNGQIDINENQGKRTDIEKIREDILLKGKNETQIILEHPNSWRYLGYIKKLCSIQERENKLDLEEKCKYQTRENLKAYYLSGKTRIGKTTYLFNKYNPKNICIINNYSGHIFDHYKSAEVLIFDDFNANIPISNMLNFTDKFPVWLPCRYENRILCANEIWVISNRKIEEQYIREKQYNPETWKAFIARFHGIYTMKTRGLLEEHTQEINTKYILQKT